MKVDILSILTGIAIGIALGIFITINPDLISRKCTLLTLEQLLKNAELPKGGEFDELGESKIYSFPESSKYQIIIKRGKLPPPKLWITNVRLIDRSDGEEKVLDRIAENKKVVFSVTPGHEGQYPSELKLTCEIVDPEKCQISTNLKVPKAEIEEWITFQKEKSIENLLKEGKNIELEMTTKKHILDHDVCFRFQIKSKDPVDSKPYYWTLKLRKR